MKKFFKDHFDIFGTFTCSKFWWQIDFIPQFSIARMDYSNLYDESDSVLDESSSTEEDFDKRYINVRCV